MKVIPGQEDKLPDLLEQAEQRIKDAKVTRLLEILTKECESRDTLIDTIAKERKAFEEKEKKNQENLKKITDRIEQIKAGRWEVIKEDGKQNTQISGGGKAEDKSE